MTVPIVNHVPRANANVPRLASAAHCTFALTDRYIAPLMIEAERIHEIIMLAMASLANH